MPISGKILLTGLARVILHAVDHRPMLAHQSLECSFVPLLEIAFQQVAIGEVGGVLPAQNAAEMPNDLVQSGSRHFMFTRKFS